MVVGSVGREEYNQIPDSPTVGAKVVDPPKERSGEETGAQAGGEATSGYTIHDDALLQRSCPRDRHQQKRLISSDRHRATCRLNPERFWVWDPVFESPIQDPDEFSAHSPQWASDHGVAQQSSFQRASALLILPEDPEENVSKFFESASRASKEHAEISRRHINNIQKKCQSPLRAYQDIQGTCPDRSASSSRIFRKGVKVL
ncbi:hypothetical protein WMF37_51820 [Sorangium sp. So ce291]|uniref:hypothetical protein n=1 Tax=Sorangium sp. So ce291 TaxID=3133294 RepID=UPI003F5E3194